MDTDTNKAVVLRYWERCWNHQDPSAIRETHHETFAQNGVPIGTAAFERSLAGFFQAFPDVRVTIEDVMAADDRVLTRVLYHGTQSGPYEGLEPSGRRIRVSGLELFLLLDGRIIQHWHEMDHLEILRQLREAPRAAM
jgi:steroid delta-isomerase-like uncharacterized protein